MTNNPGKSSVVTQVYEIYISAKPQRIWDAITDPAWNKRYGYRGPSVYDLRPGGKYAAHAPPEMRAMGLPDVVIDGEVLEADAPRKLVQISLSVLRRNERRRIHAPHVGDRGNAERILATHRDARAHRRADHGGHGVQQVLRAGHGRLELGLERPEVAARNRQDARRLTKPATRRTGHAPREREPVERHRDPAAQFRQCLPRQKIASVRSKTQNAATEPMPYAAARGHQSGARTAARR